MVFFIFKPDSATHVFTVNQVHIPVYQKKQ